MLVLTRKYQEKVRIGDGITITVLRTKGKAVRLGIEAPADVPVIRGELTFDHSMREETREAVAWNAELSQPAARRPKESQANPNVSVRRVSREKAAEILPELLSGHGPLREMLNLRTGTM